MKRRGKLIAGVFCVLVSCICISVGTNTRLHAVDLEQNITLDLKGDGIDASNLDQMMNKDQESEEENYDFAAWRICHDELVTVEELSRSRQVDAIEVYGSSRCILSHGISLQKDDSDKCIIGHKLAEQLYGGTQVEGQIITYKDRELTISGVINEPADLLMVENPPDKKVTANTDVSADLENTNTVDEAEAIVYNRISIMCGNNKNKKQYGETFINRYNMSADLVRWDYYLSFKWFTEMIPGKWSNINGWKENGSSVVQSFEHCRNIDKSIIELEYMDIVIQTYLLLVFGVVLLVAGVILLSSLTKKQLPPPGLSSTKISPL